MADKNRPAEGWGLMLFNGNVTRIQTGSNTHAEERTRRAAI